MAFPQPPSVGDKNGITAAASFSQSESQTNKDAQQLQWKDGSDDTHEVARVETSFTCNNDGRGEMVLMPRNNAHTNELENMTMQIPHSSGPVSNAVEEGIAEERARLTFDARCEGLGQSALSDEERIEKGEARRLAGGHAALRGRMDSQQRSRDSVTQDGMAKEDDAASDRGIVNTSSGAGLLPFEAEVRMMNEDGNSAISTNRDASKLCTSIKDVVRDTLDTGILSSVTPRRRLQETLAQLEWWIDEWQHKKEIYQQDKVHLQVCGPPTVAPCFCAPLTFMACCCYYLHRLFMISLRTRREMPSPLH